MSHGSKQHRGKHRKHSHRSRAIATVGVATAAAAALTVGIAPPPPDTQTAAFPVAETATFPIALTASTAPNYTQLIKDTSNSLDALLLDGTLTDALNAFLGPLGATFTSTAQQNNLLTVGGAVDALVSVLNRLNSLPDVSNVPGLPPGAGTVLTDNLGPVLDALQALLPLANILDNLSGIPGALDDALNGLNGLNSINALLTSLLGPASTLGHLVFDVLNIHIPVPQLTIPSVTGLADNLLTSLGASATDTHYASTLSWPVLGINGTSNVDNLFAQIPSLTVGALVDAVLSGVVIPNLNSILDPIFSNPLLVPFNPQIPAALDDLTGLVDAALAPLNLIATPSVTAWIPSANGLYTLPMGGSFGYLATMPTVDIGPLTVGGVTVPSNGADTVVATPIFAAGMTLPLNLGSLGVLTTPGVLFPTATGVSSLGGTTLQSLVLPGLLNLQSLNTASAYYIGTNGININTGQTGGTLVTPFGSLPFEYSLGAFNIGTTGFGYSGATFAGVTVLPGFQIGTAPVQTSDDGLLSADVINAGLTPVQPFSAKAKQSAPSKTPEVANLKTADAADKPQGDVADATIAPKKGPLLKILRGPKAEKKADDATGEPTGKFAHPRPVKDALAGAPDEVKKDGDNAGKALGAKKKDRAEKKAAKASA